MLWKQVQGDGGSKNCSMYQLQEKNAGEGMRRWVWGVY